MRNGTMPDRPTQVVGRQQSGLARHAEATAWRCLAIALLTWTTQIGCSPWTPQTAPIGPLLHSVVATDDAVTLEIFFARFPAGDAELSGPAWDDLDEQVIPIAVRQQLADNGFRAGLAAGSLPPSMARLLQLQDRSPAPGTGLQPVDLKSDPTATQRLLQIRDGQPSYIAKSETQDALSVLWVRDSQLQGRTFNRAQCLFAARAIRQEDGRVEVELIPELHYGEARQQYEGEQGIFRVQFTRPKQVFSELGIRTLLSPGQMLVVGGRNGRTGSIGHRFFSTLSDRGEEQKLLIVRLVHSTPDNPLKADRG